MEEHSDSDSSRGQDAVSDSSYTVTLDSQDEDFTVSKRSASRSRNVRQKASGEDHLRQNSSSSSNDKESQPAVSLTDSLVQTGPDTFLYFDKYSIKKAEDGYECCKCGYKHGIRATVLYHIRMVHIRERHSGASTTKHRQNLRQESSSGTTESQPPVSALKCKLGRRLVTIKTKLRQIRSLLSQPGSMILWNSFNECSSTFNGLW